MAANRKESIVDSSIRKYVLSSDMEDLQQYGKRFLETPIQSRRRFYWEVHETMRLGELYCARVLDVGCGFGWHAIALSMLGNNEVVANDVRQSMTGALDKYLKTISTDAEHLRVTTLTGDICTLEIEAGEYDGIVCNQTIEHVHSLEAMFAQCYRILKPGARIVITNDNNALNRRAMRDVRQMWQKRDRSWNYIEKLKLEKPVENADATPYAMMRRRIVVEANPAISEDAVERLVDATAGLTEAEIKEIAQAYHDNVELPRPPELSWCRNPVTGEYCERQLNPFHVAQLLLESGFSKAKVRHGFRKWPLRWFNSGINGLISEWLFQRRAFFLIVAEK